MLFNLTDNKMTGLEMMVLTSSEYANTIITHFRKMYHGQDPEELLDDICNKLNIHDGDLLPNDIIYVRDEIKEYLNGLY